MQRRNGALKDAHAGIEARKGMHWAYALLIMVGSYYVLSLLGSPFASWLLAIPVSSYNQILLRLGIALLWDQLMVAFGIVLWIQFTIKRYYESRAWANYSYFSAVIRPLTVVGPSYGSFDKATINAFPAIPIVFLVTTFIALIFGVVYVRWSIKRARDLPYQSKKDSPKAVPQ